MVLNASEVDEQTLGLSLGEKTINKKWRVRTSKRQKADTQVPPTFGPYEGSGANRKKRASKRKKPAMRARRARASEKSQVFEISRRNHMFCNGFAENWTEGSREVVALGTEFFGRQSCLRKLGKWPPEKNL